MATPFSCLSHTYTHPQQPHMHTHTHTHTNTHTVHCLCGFISNTDCSEWRFYWTIRWGRRVYHTIHSSWGQVRCGPGQSSVVLETIWRGAGAVRTAENTSFGWESRWGPPARKQKWRCAAWTCVWSMSPCCCGFSVASVSWLYDHGYAWRQLTSVWSVLFILHWFILNGTENVCYYRIEFKWFSLSENTLIRIHTHTNRHTHTHTHYFEHKCAHCYMLQITIQLQATIHQHF